MRPSPRLLTSRLPPFTPTGIAGLLTHPHPRPALIAIYNHTLSVLSQLPEHSVYRQAAENLTKQRLEAVKSIAPAGATAQAADMDIRDVGVYMSTVLEDLSQNTTYEGHKSYIRDEMQHWSKIPWPERLTEGMDVADLKIEMEPQLEAEQVMALEEAIGEGLIEEVVEEGWGELRCAEAMREGKVWEPLEVKPEEGQWVAFERTPANA